MRLMRALSRMSIALTLICIDELSRETGIKDAKTLATANEVNTQRSMSHETLTSTTHDAENCNRRLQYEAVHDS